MIPKMSSKGNSVISPQVLEDYLLYILPIAVALAGFNWAGVFPGVPGLVVAAGLGAFAKFLVGLAQEPKVSNYEDYIPALVIGLSFLATAFGQDPRLATYGLYLALIVKALPMFKQGFNIEDGILFISVILAGLASVLGQPNPAGAALVIGLIGKTVPSIATNGSPASLKST